MKQLLRIAFFLLVATNLYAAQRPFTDRYFSEVTLAVDTTVYKLSENVVWLRNNRTMYFEYSERFPVCEVRFFPREGVNIQSINFLHSRGYEVLDSLVYLEEGGYFRGRIRFFDLFNNAQLSLMLNVTTQSDNGQQRTRTWELTLFPYIQTWVNFFPSNDVLFVGEEKRFELETNLPENIRPSSEWKTSNGVDYRVVLREGALQLVLQPRELGVKTITIELETLAPFITGSKELSHQISLTLQPLTVRASRLTFLNFDKKELTYDEESRYRGVEVTLDNHARLQMNRTYRIENQEAPGGTLIGELFTIKELTNDRVLCKLTTFNMHRRHQGYLYIKLGDTPLFITNLDITPKTEITAMYVLREGEDWQESNHVNPGETVDVTIEGTSLHKARFTWQDAQDVTSDTLNQTETRRIFRLRVPMDINKRQIALLNNGQPTGRTLVVEEFLHPRPFDFITLNYGNNNRTQVNKINNTIISRSVIQEFTLSFDESIIDSRTRLYGKQYLDIDLRILGRRGEIVEMRSLKNQLVCPDETSPRGVHYRNRSCLSEDIDLNNVLSTKTSALDNFGRVQLDIRHSADRYSDPVFEKRVEVIYQPAVLFDIDLSFPAGMLIQNIGGKAEDNDVSFSERLGGISIALIAQLSFTDSEKPGRLKPWRCGAGFLFINTFNFSESAQRDLAFVAVGSIYPLSQRRMFNVPIHAGVGYRLQGRVPFVMISPGISITF